MEHMRKTAEICEKKKDAMGITQVIKENPGGLKKINFKCYFRGGGRNFHCESVAAGEWGSK